MYQSNDYQNNDSYQVYLGNTELIVFDYKALVMNLWIIGTPRELHYQEAHSCMYFRLQKLHPWNWMPNLEVA